MSSDPAALYYASESRTSGEETAAMVTHGIGWALSILAGTGLLTAVAATGDMRLIAGCGFYVLTLVAVYAASTLSHMPFPEPQKRIFRSLDQGFIYLLIVGTFTPFAMLFLSSTGWLAFYGVILAVSLGGCLSKILFGHRLEEVSVILYIALGWGEAIAIKPIVTHISPITLSWIVAGGLSYTVGTFFLIHDLRRSHFHTVWHVLVMAGSACHYIAIAQCRPDA